MDNFRKRSYILIAIGNAIANKHDDISTVQGLFGDGRFHFLQDTKGQTASADHFHSLGAFDKSHRRTKFYKVGKAVVQVHHNHIHSAKDFVARLGKQTVDGGQNCVGIEPRAVETFHQVDGGGGHFFRLGTATHTVAKCDDTFAIVGDNLAVGIGGNFATGFGNGGNAKGHFKPRFDS